MIEQLERIVRISDPQPPPGFTHEDMFRMAPKLYFLEMKRLAFEKEYEDERQAIIESRGRNE